MSIIPMCGCNLPAKIYALELPPDKCQVPFTSYFGCRKSNGGCGAFMWCKVNDNKDPNDNDGVHVYDSLVLTNVELDQKNKKLEEKNKDLKDCIQGLEDRIFRLQLDEDDLFLDDGDW